VHAIVIITRCSFFAIIRFHKTSAQAPNMKETDAAVRSEKMIAQGRPAVNSNRSGREEPRGSATFPAGAGGASRRNRAVIGAPVALPLLDEKTLIAHPSIAEAVSAERPGQESSERYAAGILPTEQTQTAVFTRRRQWRVHFRRSLHHYD
jgi:hypothetical protein